MGTGIEVNPGNFSGLAALAGTRVGNLGLPVPGELAAKQQMAAQANMTEMMKASMQNRLGEKQLAQQGSQQDQQLAFDREKLAASQSDAAANRQIQREELDAKQKIMQQQMDEKALEQAKTEKAEAIEAKASAAAMYLNLSPEERASPQTREAIVNAGSNMNWWSKEEAEQMKQMPQEEFDLAAKIWLYQSTKALTIQQALEKDKQKDSDGGTTKFYDPQTGNLLYEKQENVTTTQNKMQEDVNDREIALQQLAPLRENFNEKYLTFKGQIDKGVSSFAERSKGTPILGPIAEVGAQVVTGMSKEERSQYLKDSTKYLNGVEQFFQTQYRKPVTGAQSALAELKDLRSNFLSGDMSASEFQGAIDQIIEKYTSESEFKKNVLREGTDVSSRYYNESTGKYYDRGDIDAAAKKYGVSTDDIIKEQGLTTNAR